MDTRSVLFVASLSVSLAACEPRGEAPSPRYASASRGSVNAQTVAAMGAAPTQEALLRATAARDIGCPLADVTLELELQTRSVNAPALRFILTACGQRLLYAEDCGAPEDNANRPGYSLATRGGTTWSCRYVLAARTNLGSPAAP